jgi:hypothetical protein
MAWRGVAWRQDAVERGRGQPHPWWEWGSFRCLWGKGEVMDRALLGRPTHI